MATRAASPNNLTVSLQFVAVLGAVEDEVVAAFRHGKGVPYSSYKHFHRVMAEESGQTVVAMGVSSKPTTEMSPGTSRLRR